MGAAPNTQTFTILAQDPAVRGAQGGLVFARVAVPQESLAPGPTGYRLKVVDFNASTNRLYEAHEYAPGPDGRMADPFIPPAKPAGAARKRFDATVLANPQFHAQNVYAIVMRTLSKFEHALGRRIRWGFDGHQLHLVPHAFLEANAFYSREDKALMFGYFKGVDGRYVHTCLSHDIVAHEATHAILDGLRAGYMNESGPDQAGFHEGFADVIAMLSVFSLKETMEFALTRGDQIKIQKQGEVRLLSGAEITAQRLTDSILFGIGKEFGQQLEGLRANALRRSIALKPSKKLLRDAAYDEPHSRGEILAAAMMHALLEIWMRRVAQLGTFGGDLVNLDAVAAEGATAAEHLLNMAIRALDYCPPLDLEFSDYLAALLTVDAEVVPDDSRYAYRPVLLKIFGAFGIKPPPARTDASGRWQAFTEHDRVQYQRSNFDSMLRDCEEVFRFIWENRAVLQIDERAYTQVVSVRPSLRFGPDGFLLRETVCEYTMKANIFGAEITSVCGIERPPGVATTMRLTLYGGGTLVFDQYGRIKYHIQRPLNDGVWQEKRLRYLLGLGGEEAQEAGRNQFAQIHRMRAMAPEPDENAGAPPAAPRRATRRETAQ